MIKIKILIIALQKSKNQICGIINAKLTIVLKNISGFKIMTILKILEVETNIYNELSEDLKCK